MEEQMDPQSSDFIGIPSQSTPESLNTMRSLYSFKLEQPLHVDVRVYQMPYFPPPSVIPCNQLWPLGPSYVSNFDPIFPPQPSHPTNILRMTSIYPPVFGYGQLGRQPLRIPTYNARPDFSNLAIEEIVENLLNNIITLSDIGDKIFGVCKDDKGSKFLVNKLHNGTCEEIEIIFEMIKSNFIEIMINFPGNTVFLNFLDRVESSKSNVLLSMLCEHAPTLAFNKNGSTVLRKVLEKVNNELHIIIARKLSPSIHECIEDPNAAHVLIKIIETVETEDIPFVVNAFIQYPDLCLGICGSDIFENLLDRCTHEDRSSLMKVFYEKKGDLIRSEYGHNLVENVLTRGFDNEELIMKYVLENLFNLSREKFATYVVMKCLEVARYKKKTEFYNALCNGNNLFNLSIHEYGKNIVLKMLTLGTSNQLNGFLSKLTPHIENLRNNEFGNAVAIKVDQVKRTLARTR